VQPTRPGRPWAGRRGSSGLHLGRVTAIPTPTATIQTVDIYGYDPSASYYGKYPGYDPGSSYYGNHPSYGSQPRARQTWYYCSDPAGYYPYVTQCKTGWLPAPAR
jgi:hypothetical protein